MPKLTQLAVRAALVYLLLGALMGLAHWVDTFWNVMPAAQYLSPTYLHLIVVGWVTQLIFAVAYWMFPVVSRANLRGDARLAAAVFVTLNAGLLLRLLCEPWRAAAPTPVNAAGLLLSSILQAISAALFVAIMWPRVKERGGF